MPVFRVPKRRLDNNGKRMVINRTDAEVILSISQAAGVPPLRYQMGPGDVVEVDQNYATRRESESGHVTLSTVEKLTGALHNRPGAVVPLNTPEGEEAFRRFHKDKVLYGTRIVTSAEFKQLEIERKKREAARSIRTLPDGEGLSAE